MHGVSRTSSTAHRHHLVVAEQPGQAPHDDRDRYEVDHHDCSGNAPGGHRPAQFDEWHLKERHRQQRAEDGVDQRRPTGLKQL